MFTQALKSYHNEKQGEQMDSEKEKVLVQWIDAKFCPGIHKAKDIGQARDKHWIPPGVLLDEYFTQF